MIQPVPTSERYTILDVLRGFALLGVIVANMATHSGYFFLSNAQKENLDLLHIDGIVTWVLHFLVDGKFYSLFALLFGIGFALQMQRAKSKGTSFKGRYRRRLLILFIIGLLHAIFFYVGDILTVYAITGAFLILFRKSSSTVALRWAFVLLLLPVVQYTFFWIPAIGTPGPVGEVRNPMFDQLVLNYQQGSVFEILTTNIGGLIFGRYPELFFTGRFFRVLAMFLIGFYAARKTLFNPSGPQLSLLKRIVILGAVIGIPCNIVLAIIMETNEYQGLGLYGIIQPLVYAYGVPALCFVYTSAIILLYQKSAWQKALGAFAPVGQMALTNYLMQSVICCFIFMSYGLGWFGRVGPAILMLIGLSIYGSQVMFSKWWLTRYHFGPMEWLWRSLTYRAWQPMRRQPRLVAPPEVVK